MNETRPLHDAGAADGVPSGAPLLATTAGDLERESKSRRYNLVEALVVYLFVLVVLWPVCYGLGVLPDNEGIQDLAVLPLVLGAVYLLFVSPFVHRDT